MTREATARVVPETFGARLREITRGLITETGSPDPHVVARAVIERLTARQYKEALEVCLADWVRTQMSHGSRNLHKPKPGLSKPDRIRSWYARKLAESMFVGTEWKFLRDCTADDLHVAAAERYRKASETHSEGDRWSKVALFMEEQGRATVADISESEFKQLMEAAS